MAPALVLLASLVLWPAVDAVAIAFESWTGYAPQARFIGWENFLVLAGDAKFGRSLLNTVAYTVVGGVGHFAFAFLFLAGLTHPDIRGKRFFQTLIIFPTFVSIVGVGVLWRRLYHPTQGLLNAGLSSVGLDAVGWLSEDFGLLAMVWSSIWAGVGSQLLLLLAGARRISPSLYEAARLEGANEWQAFRQVTVPLVADVTLVALMLWIIGAMQIFGLPQALAGPVVPSYLETVSTHQYAIAFNARDAVYLMGRGSAMAVVLVVVTFLLVGTVRGPMTWIRRRS